MTANNLFFIRENIIKTIRSYFDKRGFQEIFIPVLNSAVPLEPYIYPFTTIWETSKEKTTFYLPVSPERQMIHALAQKVGNCYAIGASFRNLEQSGTIHSPEFTMVEWYRPGKKLSQVMKDLTQLIFKINKQFNCPIELSLPWPIFSLEKLFQEICSLDYQRFIEDEAYAFSQAKNKGYQTANALWEELFTQIFANEIEPMLFQSRRSPAFQDEGGPKNPFFLIDFPSRSSPLCLVDPKKPYLAQRFELYIAGVELANGSPENTDADAVRSAFIAEQKRRARNKQPVPTLDEQFLNDLHKLKLSGKNYPGVGLGLERLIKVLSKHVS